MKILGDRITHTGTKTISQLDYPPQPPTSMCQNDRKWRQCGSELAQDDATMIQDDHKMARESLGMAQDVTRMQTRGGCKIAQDSLRWLKDGWLK